MATTFAISAPSFTAGVPGPVTLTLDSSHGSAINFALTASPSGVFSNASPTIPSGTTVTVNFTPSQAGQVTITAQASGGITVAQAATFKVNYPTKTTTANQIIAQALSHLGVRAAADKVDGQEALDALYTLNLLVDAWRVDPLSNYAIQRVTFTLPQGSASATIGPSGDIVLPYRPVRLEQGSFVTTGDFDYPLEVLSDVDYQQIQWKGIATSGPSAMFYEPTLPNGTIWFYPGASGNAPLKLQVVADLLEFADLTTGYVLSPGYARFLGLALAEELAPAYERVLNPVVQRNLMAAKKSIRLANYTTPRFKPGRGGGNIYVGWEGGNVAPLTQSGYDGGDIGTGGGSGSGGDGGEI